jgi:hypothetical protein
MSAGTKVESKLRCQLVLNEIQAYMSAGTSVEYMLRCQLGTSMEFNHDDFSLHWTPLKGICPQISRTVKLFHCLFTSPALQGHPARNARVILGS